MKTLYIECNMGAAGDMLTASLLELIEDKESFLKEINALGIPHVTIDSEHTSKCGIGGTHMIIKVNGEEEESHDVHEHHHEHEHTHEEHHHHHHSGMHEIGHIIEDLKVSSKVKKDILGVYQMIAEAESHVHGVPVAEIHFHEVGTMDAIADITAVCLLMEKINPDQVIVSPIHVGSGQVKCAHGILPVPAPATAYILKDIPIYGGSVQGELCTPTGAALLKYFADSFGNMPVMKIEQIGYGMGKKDFDTANCVRTLLGSTEDQTEDVYELNCNVDDMTAEEIGYAQERLFEAGAYEVFTVAVGMKKSRPGTLLRVICSDQNRETMAKAIFRYTTTIGIREVACNRYTLDRKIMTVHTEVGDIRRKDSTGYGISRSKYEYEDLSKIAKEKGMTIEEVRDLAKKADQ